MTETAPNPSRSPLAAAERAKAPTTDDALGSHQLGTVIGRRRLLERITPWLTSALVHSLVVLVLAWWLIQLPAAPASPGLIASIAEEEDAETPQEFPSTEGDAAFDAPVAQFADTDLPDFSVAMPTPEAVLDADTDYIELPELWSEEMSVVRGGSLVGRSAANRRRLALANGGSEGSESAVERGLHWLAAHQMRDGSWRFDFRDSPQCEHHCRHPGRHSSTTASTGLALLCFLGAGYTPTEGQHQEVVSRGIYYLLSRLEITERGGSLLEESMYGHGIATLALCEAYALTGDTSLAGPAQQAIDFIVAAQHHAGGWRYDPGEAGDTTVSGWQIMALKSGALGGLRVPTITWHQASSYLDSVQAADGAYYGYQDRQRSPATTAVGLLCRMLLGWQPDHKPLIEGVTFLGGLDPVRQNSYHNYYAAQVLHHFGGYTWEQWNQRIRERLIATQSSVGHEAGSWYFVEEHATVGGRLYTTAMAILTLEVYYRYLPLYRDTLVDVVP